MDTRITLMQGDITTLAVDAIVNAANSSLMGGGGVDGAIHRAGGPAILDDCRHIIARQGSCKPGDAVITTAGRLPARFVIHTVGPVWNGGQHNEVALLGNCYRNSLELAIKNEIRTIAFPNISTGIYRFPKYKAASVAIETVNNFLEKNRQLTSVAFVCYDEENLLLYQKILSDQ